MTAWTTENFGLRITNRITAGTPAPSAAKKIRKADVDIDHIIPQKYGGADSLYNLQCLCKHCNRSKQASLKDTLPDLVKTNHQRAVKAVKKSVANAKASVVKSVKSAAKSAVKSVTKKITGGSSGKKKKK